MKIKILVALLFACGPCIVSSAQSAPNTAAMVTLVGCIERGTGEGLFVAKATAPKEMDDRLPEQPAFDVPLGTGRVRLIGTLDEFGVAAHVEQKVWVKGLYIEGESENRLNLVSITHLDGTCQ